ncbi:MAG TPA: hypothetical protein VGQ20_09940, partial [Acidimicrobiales bacterium]|nr:hypothetical protein [Acidimicrobiales bacterium]
MPSPRLRLPAADPVLDAGLAQIRTRLDVPITFPQAVDAEAAVVAHRGPTVSHPARADRREIPFVT